MIARVLMGAVFLIAPMLASSEHLHSEERQAFRRPEVVPFPETAPYDREIATLGKMLFFDPRLSMAQNISCATCHNPSFGWEAPVARAIGANNILLSRHTPTILNSAWSQHFFWNGRARTLETQAKAPLTAPDEMNSSFTVIKSRLSNIDEYKTHFDRLFPDEGISEQSVLRSLATFERTVMSELAPFDRWVQGDETAISDASKRGFSLFVGKGQCAECHDTWRFASGGFFNVGSQDRLFSRYTPPPSGAPKPHFKVPTLRNISLRAPYMHLGNIGTLEEVVEHYASVDPSDTTLDVRPFPISDAEIDDLVSFLKTLTEEGADVGAPVLPAN